jgi:hypothetical protein
MPDQPHRYSTCQGVACGRLIMWVLTEGGKRMPVDPEPADDGNVVLARQDDGTVRARVLTGSDPIVEGRLTYRPHHRTCPDSAEFRRKKAATALRCLTCHDPMSDWLIDRGWKHHVCCKPLTAAELAAAERACAWERS